MDLVQTIKICQVELHEMILDGPHIVFTFNPVPSFQSLVQGRHDITLMKYITNFKKSIE